jgi:hypothetical protein
MTKWPNWHNKYPFNDFYINKFVSNEPGVFYIFNYDNGEIIYFGFAENLKFELLKLYEMPSSCILDFLKSGCRLGFSYFKALNPKRFYNQVLESYNKTQHKYPKCQEI